MEDQGKDPQEGVYRRMQREADRICSLIVASDYPAVDVAIEARRLREFSEEAFPGRTRLFRMIYESRFKRLWSQFRPDSDELPVW